MEMIATVFKLKGTVKGLAKIEARTNGEIQGNSSFIPERKHTLLIDLKFSKNSVKILNFLMKRVNISV
jgi:hypothetical protein